MSPPESGGEMPMRWRNAKAQPAPCSSPTGGKPAVGAYLPSSSTAHDAWCARCTCTFPSMTEAVLASGLRARLVNIGCTGLVIGVHGLCLLVPFVAFSWRIAAFATASYLVQVFGITGGYHRYFSHHAFKTSRVFQFVLAWLGCSAMQNGPLWWASGHRRHHRFSDKPGDPHSPVLRGFLYAHIGWVLDGDQRPPRSRQRARPHPLPRAAVPGRVEVAAHDRDRDLSPRSSSVCPASSGSSASRRPWRSTRRSSSTRSGTCAGHAGTRPRTRRATTRCSPSSCWARAGTTTIITRRAWHATDRMWWEIDATYYVIRLLQALGIVWAVREPRSQGA